MTKDEFNRIWGPEYSENIIEKRNDECRLKIATQMEAQITALRAILDQITFYAPETQELEWFDEVANFIEYYDDVFVGIATGPNF